MMISQTEIRVKMVGGLTADLAWLAPARVPAGVRVDVADFGYRVTLIVTRGQDSVTLVADLETGDAALSATVPDEAPLVEYARRLLAARMVMEVPDPGPASEDPATELRGLVEAAGGTWVSTDPDDGSPLTRQASRTDSDE